LKNKDKVKEWHRDYRIVQREQITDVYIKRLLTEGNTLCAKDIPEWLIKAKRNELKLKRIIKGENNNEKENR